MPSPSTSHGYAATRESGIREKLAAGVKLLRHPGRRRCVAASALPPIATTANDPSQAIPTQGRGLLEPIQEVVESDESVVILWLALDSRGGSARCGSLNIALLRTAAVFVIRVI